MNSSSINLNTLLNQAVSLHNAGDVKEAISLYQQLLAISPNQPVAYLYLGNAFQSVQCVEEAIVNYDQAILLKPDFIDAHRNRGIILNQLNRFDEALVSFQKAIELNSNQPMLHFGMGNILDNLKRFEEALESYDKAIALQPDYVEAYCNRGVILKNLKRFEEALENYDKAIALKPDCADVYSNKADVLIGLKQFDEALKNCDRSILLNQNNADAYLNRGVALGNLKRFEEALKAYDQTISLNPELVDAYWNKSLTQLVLGDYRSGLELYEWRWKLLLNQNARKFSEPLWLGNVSISGKTILIYAEQGLGDVIQFCRYVRMAKDLGANVILEVYPPLVSLLSTLKSDITIIEKGVPLPSFDFQCPIMSLPLAFKTTLENIPVDVPYLFSNPDKQKLWKKRLGIKTKKRIGLVCSGSTILTNDSQRTIALHLFKPLLALPFEFHLIQKEIRVSDEVFLTENLQIQTHVNDLTDFSDTAALVMEMDLVISVDTSVAHLAGALGKPVWVLLPWNLDWRWLLDRNDSPWYPTATLFRQREIENWEGVFDDVCERLNSYE